MYHTGNYYNTLNTEMLKNEYYTNAGKNKDKKRDLCAE